MLTFKMILKYLEMKQHNILKLFYIVFKKQRLKMVVDGYII